MMKLSAVLCGAAAIAASPTHCFSGRHHAAVAQALAPRNVVPVCSLSGLVTPGRDLWLAPAQDCQGPVWAVDAEGLRPRMRRRIDYNEAVAVADAPSSRPNRPAGRQGLTELTAVAAVTAMRSGDLKAEDYAHALLDRAQHLERLNAFRTLDKEMVLEAARAADKVHARGDAMGLLHGLPIPVKDSIDSKALPTSNGTRALRDFRPRDDAGVLKSLLAQGAILMGKTNLHELSYGWTSSNAI